MPSFMFHSFTFRSFFKVMWEIFQLILASYLLNTNVKLLFYHHNIFIAVDKKKPKQNKIKQTDWLH